MRKTSRKKNWNDDRSSGEMKIKTNFKIKQACVQIQRHFAWNPLRSLEAYDDECPCLYTHFKQKMKTFRNYLDGKTTWQLITRRYFFTLFISEYRIYDVHGMFVHFFKSNWNRLKVHSQMLWAVWLSLKLNTCEKVNTWQHLTKNKFA